ncbi:MAG: A/G-specific adenine glycosylase [Acidobacteriota bacterium]|nr:A/G-specific adenine glycosylase [Acidobacteriota bacterium]
MSFAAALAKWYQRGHRDLPWRNTADPYPIWVSEIMLQQTRAQAAIPYYAKFLQRFPTVESLAMASEPDVLACWSGLGYYSRARNLRKAAAEIVRGGRFPASFEDIHALPGVGPYTAAAIASIAFQQPHAALDGNVFRVISRLANDAGEISSGTTRKRFERIAAGLLDRRNPGQFNQAMMELGATVCLPRAPLCLLCPVKSFCDAHRAGTQGQLPVKARLAAPERLECTLALVERRGKILLRQRAGDSRRMAGFWELPNADEIPHFKRDKFIGTFTHTIVRQHFTFTLYTVNTGRKPAGFQWVERDILDRIPVTTITRKAIVLARRS